MASEQVTSRAHWSHEIATLFASLGFLVLVAAITYFALLVASVEFGEGEAQVRAYSELGEYLGGGLEWYRDARVLGAISLLAALVSLLFGVHPFARITIPVAALTYLTLHIFNEEIIALLQTWALQAG